MSHAQIGKFRVPKRTESESDVLALARDVHERLVTLMGHDGLRSFLADGTAAFDAATWEELQKSERTLYHLRAGLALNERGAERGEARRA